MSKYIQKAIKLKKKNLTSQLIKMGVFTKDDKHLYELTLNWKRKLMMRRFTSYNHISW